MLHAHELSVPPISALVYRMIDDKIWERHLLGYNHVNIEFRQISPKIIDDLKTRCKVVEVLGHTGNTTLHLEW
jgi:hypothetical protein